MPHIEQPPLMSLSFISLKEFCVLLFDPNARSLVNCVLFWYQTSRCHCCLVRGPYVRGLPIFNTPIQFLTNSKPLIWLTTRERPATHGHRSVVCHPLKEQSHKVLLILRKNSHGMLLRVRNHYRSSILLLRRLL